MNNCESYLMAKPIALCMLEKAETKCLGNLANCEHPLAKLCWINEQQDKLADLVKSLKVSLGKALSKKVKK